MENSKPLNRSSRTGTVTGRTVGGGGVGSRGGATDAAGIDWDVRSGKDAARRRRRGDCRKEALGAGGVLDSVVERLRLGTDSMAGREDLRLGLASGDEYGECLRVPRAALRLLLVRSVVMCSC